jgi:alkylhydroperoxidase/carboxymuconolactone decarboxylase family protein YurZ
MSTSEPPLSGAAILARNPASPVAPHLRRYVECYLETFLRDGRLEPRLRQLAILRIAWRARQPYMWANHYRNARNAGVSDEEALAARRPAAERSLDPAAAFTLDAVDVIIDRDLLPPEVYARAMTVLGGDEVVEEFIHLVGGYRSMAVLLNTRKPSLEAAGLPFWPPDGAAPQAR